jgi:hypothetical protein
MMRGSGGKCFLGDEGKENVGKRRGNKTEGKQNRTEGK